MASGSAWPIAVGLAAYVALSSFLALCAGQPWEVEKAFAEMVRMWSASAPADAIFVVGSLVTGYVAFGFAREGRGHRGLALAALGTLVTYELGFFLVSGEGLRGGHVTRTLLAPFQFGGLGLVFAVLAPVFAGRPWAADPLAGEPGGTPPPPNPREPGSTSGPDRL